VALIAESSSFGASAAVKTDGSVVTWGDSNSGGDSSSVGEDLANVIYVFGSTLYKSDSTSPGVYSVDCSPGSNTIFVAVDGTISRTSTCTACDAYQASNNGLAACMYCASGTDFTDSSSTCSVCAAGKSSVGGESACTDCPAGTSS
jgi:hypothetical protein